MASNGHTENPVHGIVAVNGGDVEGFEKCIDDISKKVNELQQKVVEVEQFYSSKDGGQANPSKSNVTGKEKVKEKHLSSNEKHQQDSSSKETSGAKRMQELMRQFATIFRQITQHKWAWPFMEPVDVEGLKLHDYYEVIKKPMDLGTIKTKMEAKDDTGYNNVREIYADVRLVFKNAMTYNDERDDAYVMARTLLEKFEEKWLLLLPKVAEEEKRQAEEEADVRLNKQLAQEVAHANMARDLSNELSDIDVQLDELRDRVVHQCRKLTTEEKKGLSSAITRLGPEDLQRALEIVSEGNPGFYASAPEVDIDFDLQSHTTMWRLKVLVQEALKAANKSSVGVNGQNNNAGEINKNTAKRKKEITDAMNKAAIKRTKKP